MWIERIRVYEVRMHLECCPRERDTSLDYYLGFYNLKKKSKSNHRSL
jgi:hypothetical protein